jgi:hypothetical protein
MASSEQGQNETVYVVQYETDEQVWTDLGSYRVPAKTRRMDVIRRAFKESLDSGQTFADSVRFRVLDEDNAKSRTVELVPRDPELRIR